jgi:CHAT domain-containing protein
MRNTLLADGRADGFEIANARLAYDEVVLSACSTGLRALAWGDMEPTGDDIVGLPGAFLEAGARSILVSITEAADLAAGALMSGYYQQRMSGRPPLLALQAAQKAMLAADELPPFHWCGFTAYGAQ